MNGYHSRPAVVGGDRRFVSPDDLDAPELARRDPEAPVEGSPDTELSEG